MKTKTKTKTIKEFLEDKGHIEEIVIKMKNTIYYWGTIERFLRYISENEPEWKVVNSWSRIDDSTKKEKMLIEVKDYIRKER